jgi:hypothetical protein
MKGSIIIACTAALFLLDAPVHAADCDRGCLASLMERYLAALDAHDAKQLPLARGAKFTENTVALTLGDGFWQTIDKGSQSPTSRLIIADPGSSQVAFYGAAKENGHGVLFGTVLAPPKIRLCCSQLHVANPENSMAALEARILRLERQIEVLSRNLANRGTEASGDVAGTGNRARAVAIVARAGQDLGSSRTSAQIQAVSDAVEQDLDADDAASQRIVSHD